MGRGSRKREQKDAGLCGHDPWGLGLCGTSPDIRLRFNSELAAVVRVNLQRCFLAMTPISATICGRQLLAAAGCQRAMQSRTISPCVMLDAGAQWPDRAILQSAGRREVLAARWTAGGEGIGERDAGHARPGSEHRREIGSEVGGLRL